MASYLMWNPAPLAKELEKNLSVGNLSILHCILDTICFTRNSKLQVFSLYWPDPEMILCCHHRAAAFSTETSHKLGILGTAISHFNEVRCRSLAIYINGVKGYVDECSTGLRNQVDAICQFWVGIWVIGWEKGSTCIWVVSSTICEPLKWIVFDPKSWPGIHP